MSRRYGRNQKRAAREREAALAGDLADAKDQLYGLSALMAGVRKERDILAAAIDRARYLLGDHIALPPRNRGAHPHPLGGDFTDFPRLTAANRGRWTPGEGLERTKVRTLRMLELAAKVRRQPGFDQEVHCHVTLDGGHVVYAISDVALSRASAEQLAALLENEIAPALATLLAEGTKHPERRRYVE